MDMNFIGNVNSIYALLGFIAFIIFSIIQMCIKAKADKDAKAEKKIFDAEKLAKQVDMHKETLDAQNKSIEAQNKTLEAISTQSKLIAESLNRNNEITDLNKDHIIDIAEVIDKKHKTKKATVYKERYKQAEDKHKKKFVV